MKTYAEKLRDPRWQRKRLEIMQRDNFTCTQCGDTTDTQNVHHWQYSKEPWDAKNQDLTTVCRSCHEQIEKCKDLTKDFLRQSDFRMLLEQIERLLKNRAVKVVAFDDCVTVVLVDYCNNDEPSAFDRLIDDVEDEQISIGYGYRFLVEGETIEVGDSFRYAFDLCQDWNLFGNAVGQPYKRLYGCAGRRKFRKNEDAMSIFDKLIARADADY